MQVENEYGYFGDDSTYMEMMKNILIEGGIDVPLITSDGPTDENIQGGSVENALPTGNFGSKTKERFQILSKHTKGGHMTGNLAESTKDLDDMLDLGHVNVYMFIGGTNFGFMNGSNYYEELTPDVTSYDYDAVLTEAGDFTEKYYAYQKVIGKYADIPEITFSTEIKKKAYGNVALKEKVGLFQVLDDLASSTQSTNPQAMELLGQNYGYILYSSPVRHETKLEKIRLWKANDRANIFVGNDRIANLYDRELLEECTVDKSVEKGQPIRILVENMGRVNFGSRMQDQRKGIDGCVQINGHMHSKWNQYCLPLDNLEMIDYSKEYDEGLPAFYKFEFDVDEVGDTFLDMEGFGKGCAFINGFNLGRYWEIGPQKRLYIPGPLLRTGMNELILFETEGKAVDSITLCDLPDIG